MCTACSPGVSTVGSLHPHADPHESLGVALDLYEVRRANARVSLDVGPRAHHFALGARRYRYRYRHGWLLS